MQFAKKGYPGVSDKKNTEGDNSTVCMEREEGLECSSREESRRVANARERKSPVADNQQQKYVESSMSSPQGLSFKPLARAYRGNRFQRLGALGSPQRHPRKPQTLGLDAFGALPLAACQKAVKPIEVRGIGPHTTACVSLLPSLCTLQGRKH